MFERWRQENFFKYLREEYAIDALADHAVEPDNPERDVPNPVWHQLDAQLPEAKVDLASLYATYGIKAAANQEGSRPTMRGFKIAHGKLGHEIRQAIKRVDLLRVKRDRTPHRVPVKDAVTGPVIRLAHEPTRPWDSVSLERPSGIWRKGWSANSVPDCTTQAGPLIPRKSMQGTTMERDRPRCAWVTPLTRPAASRVMLIPSYGCEHPLLRHLSSIPPSSKETLIGAFGAG